MVVLLDTIVAYLNRVCVLESVLFRCFALDSVIPIAHGSAWQRMAIIKLESNLKLFIDNLGNR